MSHCGAILSYDEIICSCGFNFPLAGSAGRGAKAARDVAARITGTRRALRGKKAKKPPRKVSAKVIEPGTLPQGTPHPVTPPRGTSLPGIICGSKIRIHSSVCPGCGDPDPINP